RRSHSVQTGAISPVDKNPREASVFPASVSLVGGVWESGLTKKRRLLREYARLSYHTKHVSRKGRLDAKS
ncbi:MAG: hypothetical protein QGF59_20155, partial [Pirellulaceae bacterium]|nr:hypothetical protein [Pirellulaceae bacterium]